MEKREYIIRQVLLPNRDRRRLADRLWEEGGRSHDAAVGVKVPVMGWNWAVFLAQSFLMDMTMGPMGANIGLDESRMLIEGAAPPVHRRLRAHRRSTPRSFERADLEFRTGRTAQRLGSDSETAQRL